MCAQQAQVWMQMGARRLEWTPGPEAAIVEAYETAIIQGPRRKTTTPLSQPVPTY